MEDKFVQMSSHEAVAEYMQDSNDSLAASPGYTADPPLSAEGGRGSEVEVLGSAQTLVDEVQWRARSTLRGTTGKGVCMEKEEPSAQNRASPRAAMTFGKTL